MCSFVIIVDYVSAHICIRIVVSRLYNRIHLVPFHIVLSFSFLLPGRLALPALQVISVLVVYPGSRIPEMFGKLAAMTIQMLTLMVPQLTLPASCGRLSGHS